MLYDEIYVTPMRQELVRIGFEELKTPEEVDKKITESKGTLLVVVNSVCGCAAGMARPGVAMALRNENVPDHLSTVFAGQDLEATAKARSYIEGEMPSSPSVALFEDGKLVWFLPRYMIEGQSAEGVANLLIEAFDKYCSKKTVSQ